MSTPALFESLVTQLLAAKGAAAHDLTDDAAARAGLPVSAQERLVHLPSVAAGLTSGNPDVRCFAARFLERTARDGVELAAQAAPLLRAVVDSERAANGKSTVAAVARLALAQALMATRQRDAFVEAAKAVDVDLDAAQRRTFRKLLVTILPESLVALGGKASRPRRPLHESELLAAIHDAPDDDAPRLVYADALLEVGDPRGELIVLQCARATTGAPATERELQLLRLNERAWLGPLAAAVSNTRFERGFLVACTWKQTNWSFDETKLHGHSVWTTIEAIHLRRGAFVRDDNALLADPVMHWLRTLTGIDRISFAGLERNDLEHVGIIHFQADDKTLAALARHERLLRIDIDRDPAALCAWAYEHHPAVQTITWGERRFDRTDKTWAESKLA